MRLSNASKLLLIVLFGFFEVAPVSAVTPNSRLLSLVPPSAQVVAGMSASSTGGQPGSFLLITHNNSMDLDDFVALSGGDPTRVIEQVIMAAADGRGPLTEHGLLASGHFDQARIRRSTAGASDSLYREIPVLVVQPFARERASFNDVRWLAIIDSKIAIFGTISLVKQELDRYLSRSVADPFLVQRLGRLRADDDTWCVLTRHVYGDTIGDVLELLDAKLADSLEDGDTFLFGIHYGRRVEFEYEFDTPRSVGADAVSRSLVQSLAGRDVTDSSQFAASTVSQSDRVVHGALKVSRARYDAWLEEVAARARLRVAAILRDPPTHAN
jgi:hypothetical protein